MKNHGKLITRRDALRTAAGVAAATGLGAKLAAPALAQQQSVRILTVGDPFYFSLEPLLGDFEAETGIKAEMESLAYDAMQARLVSSFVSKTSDADVVTVDQMWTGQYIDNGWIMPLNDFAMNDSSLDIGDFYPEVLYSLNTWRGLLATLPVAAYAQGVMYRDSVLATMGMGDPMSGPDWTWDAYRTAIEEINGSMVDGTSMYGTVVCGAQPVPIVHMFTQVAASFGARWFERFPEGDEWDFTPRVNSPEFAAAVELYKALYALSPPEAINYTWFDAGTRFSQGDIGMFYWWTPYFYLIKNNGYMTGERSVVIDDYSVADLPVAGSVPQTVSLGGWSFGIPSSTANAEAAWEFLKWSTSSAVQKKMGMDGTYNYQFSDFSRKSNYADADLKQIYPYLDAQEKMMLQGNGKIARPPAPIYTTLEGILGLQLNKILIGEQSVADGLATTESLFSNTLNGNFMLPYMLPSYNDTLDATKQLISDLA